MNILAIWIAFLFAVHCEDIPLKRNSFVGPFVTNVNVPHWRLIGDAKISSNAIELTPMQPNRKGSAWNLVTLKPIDWEVRVHISFGPESAKRVAAGIAIWLTREKEMLGAAFGSANIFHGLGVMFDTYDNNGDGHSPTLYGVWNDGDKEFDMSKDNKQTSMSVLGSCRVTREPNAEHVIKLHYLKGRLTVSYQNRLYGEHSDFEFCFSAPIQIPRGLFLGASSNTGGFMDLHKLHSFQTFSISGETEQLTNEENVPAEPQVEPGHEPEHEPQSEPAADHGPDVAQQQLHQGWGQHRPDPAQRRQEQTNEQQRREHAQKAWQRAQTDGLEKDLKEKIDLQIKKHLELEQAIVVLSQEADELFADLENRASHELRELQNKVVLLHPEVETLAHAKPSIVEIESAITELQNALDHLERVTHLENQKIETIGTGFSFVPSASSWDKWVWLLVLQSVGIVLFVTVQRCRKPAKVSRF